MRINIEEIAKVLNADTNYIPFPKDNTPEFRGGFILQPMGSIKFNAPCGCKGGVGWDIFRDLLTARGALIIHPCSQRHKKLLLRRFPSLQEWKGKNWLVA